MSDRERAGAERASAVGHRDRFRSNLNILMPLMVRLYDIVGPDLGAAMVLSALALLTFGKGDGCSARDLAAVTGLTPNVTRRRIARLSALGLVHRDRTSCRLSADGRRTLTVLYREAAAELHLLDLAASNDLHKN